ncbi:MAG: ATP-binding protein, partial [Oscillatoriales cyanobacterium]
LVNSEHKILLIDEIENGIHYTNQREFWRMLFRLAVELDTQIFATTHSLEMLQAFADVGLEPDQKCSSAYFELARKLKTNQIIGSRLDLETLNYALEHKEGVRGE